MTFNETIKTLLIFLSLILESSELTAKACWDYGKLENPYTKLESTYGKLESPYSKLESTYGKLESPYAKLDNPYSKLESPYSKLESPYSKLENPYSKLESPYASSLTSQHFNNIKMDPQQGKYNSMINPSPILHFILTQNSYCLKIFVTTLNPKQEILI